MRRSVVAWLLFALVLAVPSVFIYVVAARLAIKEDHQLRQARYDRRVELAKWLQRELELARWKTEDALWKLPVIAGPFEVEKALLAAEGTFSDAYTVNARGDLVVLGDDPAASARVGAIRRETSASGLVLGAASSDHLLLRSGREGAPVFVLKRSGPSGYVGFRSTPDGGEAGFATSDASVRRGCAKFLPEDLTVVPYDPNSPSDVEEYDRRWRRDRSAVELPIHDVKTNVMMPSTNLSYQVVPKEVGMAARELRRPAHRIPAITALAILVWVTSASILFAQKRRAQRLAELRTDFVAAVSHELRTPLASVRMLAELLETNAVTPDERPEIEQTLAGEARRLTGTLERMLRFGALARGKLVAAKEQTPLRPILDAAAARFRTARPEASVTVDATPSLEASVDPALLGLALDNLLGNAAKYAPEGGPYAVEAREEGRHVIVSVTDRGPGIGNVSPSRVFQPFERGDSRLSRATEGTGVGLALVRGIARAHGGDATVESTPDVRTTFALRLPRV